MKEIIHSIMIRVIKEYHIAEARQAARAMSKHLGFKDAAVCSISTSVSELGNNLFFHTIKGGAITLQSVEMDGKTGIEIIAEDQGPGIPDIELAMEDGYSTAGGLGGGLSGVKRLMDEFDIVSETGKGTRIIVRKWNLHHALCDFKKSL